MKANQKKAGQQAAAKPGRTAKPRKDLMAGMRLALAQHGGENWGHRLDRGGGPGFLSRIVFPGSAGAPREFGFCVDIFCQD